MDAFSWIEFPSIKNSKDRFEKWVDKWVLPHEHVVCNAIDLYAYRSAMLHRFGTQSRLVENKQASAILFSRGGAPFKALDKFRSIYMEDFGEDRHLLQGGQDDQVAASVSQPLKQHKDFSLGLLRCHYPFRTTYRKDCRI